MAKKSYEIAPLTAARRRQLHRLEKVLGVKFNNIELLHVALTHKSYAKSLEANEESSPNPPIELTNFAHNERLEFLGDAVLELASSIYLFTKFENLSEGELTKTRATIVCGPTLTKLANKLGFGQILLMNYGEFQQGGRKRDSNLEDSFEAVIGAIYLDQGWEVAKDYVWRQMANEFKNVKLGKAAVDVKTFLQEYSQHQYDGALPEYIAIGEEGPPHDRTFEAAVKLNGELMGTGIGRSKQLAEKAAAEVALKKLKLIEN